MNKIFIGLVSLCLLFALTNCSKESIETGDSQNQIKIQSFLGKQTKATEFSYWNVLDKFPVEAYKTSDGTSFDSWDLEYISASPNEWSYGTPVNQPGYSLTYFAWYPETIATFSSSGNPVVATLGYIVETDPADQEDLIAATTISSFPLVPLEFNHILSQVNFAVQGVQDLKVKIENIVVNVNGKATYTFGGGWAGHNTSDAYAYTPVGASETDGLNTDVLYMGNGNGAYANANALMLLPQTFVAGGGNFTFDFTLTDRINDIVEGTGSVTVDLSELTTGWVMGRRYLYVIDFTDYLAGGPIVFTVTVNPWADADASNIAQPVIVADATQLSIEAAIATQNAAKGVDAGLTVFPIWVPTDLTTTVELENYAPATNNFVTGDVIRINFPSAAGIANLNLTLSSDMDANWTLNKTANPVTLTKK